MCNGKMQKIEIRVNPDDGLLSSVKVDGVEIGRSYNNDNGNFKTDGLQQNNGF